jgi:hypothetical protein
VLQRLNITAVDFSDITDDKQTAQELILIEIA